MAFVPEGQADPSQHEVPVCVLAPAISPEGLAPKGPESLAQGLPWLSGKERFALKGLEADAIRSRGSEVSPGRT